jgi:hypothetical protein
MKRILWNITLASLITLIVYYLLFFVLGAILNEVQNAGFRVFFLALVMSVAFGFFLLYRTKIKKSIGEDEVMADYKDRTYTSIIDDFKLLIKREAKILISIAGIVLVCFVLNTFDSLVFGKKTISIITVFFLPLCSFDMVINIPFVGYLVSAIFDCAAYIVCLMIHRKKMYNHWMKNKV